MSLMHRTPPWEFLGSSHLSLGRKAEGSSFLNRTSSTPTPTNTPTDPSSSFIPPPTLRRHHSTHSMSTNSAATKDETTLLEPFLNPSSRLALVRPTHYTRLLHVAPRAPYSLGNNQKLISQLHYITIHIRSSNSQHATHHKPNIHIQS